MNVQFPVESWLADEEVKQAITVVVEPQRGGAETGVAREARFGRHVNERTLARVVKETALANRGNENIGEAVVIVIGDGNAHTVDFDVETGGTSDVGEGAIAVVTVQVGSGPGALMAGPVHAVHQQNIEPAIVIVIEKSAAGSKSFGKIPGTERAVVVTEVEAGIRCNVGQLETGAGRARPPGRTRGGGTGQKGPAVHAKLTNPVRMACTTSSAVL